MYTILLVNYEAEKSKGKDLLRGSPNSYNSVIKDKRVNFLNGQRILTGISLKKIHKFPISS